MNETVTFLPMIERRWLLWQAIARISRTWQEPGGMEEGRTYKLLLSTHWRRDHAVERAKLWVMSAEEQSRKAGIEVICGVYLDGQPVLAQEDE